MTLSTGVSKVRDVADSGTPRLLARAWRHEGQGAVLRRVTFGLCLLVIGGLAGNAIGRQAASHRAHQSGACIALEMTAAHGAIDDVQYRRIIFALTSVNNPYSDSLTVSNRQLLQHCRDIRSGGMLAKPHSADAPIAVTRAP